ncbi:hypothetical protein HanRHA438_Chr10g0462761 [Helianthus annuus]|nr:hypothetical protein HanRHA438_Chr10g0462761 [Helianthus annuus]
MLNQFYHILTNIYMLLHRVPLFQVWSPTICKAPIRVDRVNVMGLFLEAYCVAILGICNTKVFVGSCIKVKIDLVDVTKVPMTNCESGPWKVEGIVTRINILKYTLFNCC